MEEVETAQTEPSNKKLSFGWEKGKKNCGDETAQEFDGKTLEDLYSLSAGLLGTTVEDLMGKYGHLNKGLQRLNLGNRVRALRKKAA